jgi:hypothetical protein
MLCPTTPGPAGRCRMRRSAEPPCGLIRSILTTGDAVAGASDAYGNRYTVDFEVSRGDRHATVRSAWIVLGGEASPRLTSGFVLLD